MYRRIAEDLRQKIESGELGHGAQLPTELELREHYDASRSTIRDAVKWLITRRLVETRPGQGSFVIEKIGPFVTTLSEPESGLGAGEGVSYASQVTALGRKPTTSTPRVEIQPATEEIETALRLDVGATVVSRHQQRYIDGTPSSARRMRTRPHSSSCPTTAAWRWWSFAGPGSPRTESRSDSGPASSPPTGTNSSTTSEMFPTIPDPLRPE